MPNNEDIIEEDNIDGSDEGGEDNFSGLDELIGEIDNDNDGTPTRPTFFPESDDEGLDDEGLDDEKLDDEELDDEKLDDEKLDDEELDDEEEEDIDNLFSDEDIDDLAEGFEDLEERLEESERINSGYKEAIGKLGSHPVLGKLNERIINGEDVNISEWLEKSIQEDADELPDMENIATESTGVDQPISLQDRLTQRAKNSY